MYNEGSVGPGPFEEPSKIHIISWNRSRCCHLCRQLSLHLSPDLGPYLVEDHVERVLLPDVVMSGAVQSPTSKQSAST